MPRWITKNGVHIQIDDDSLYSALEKHYSKGKFPTLYLEKKEYAHVMSEINTWYVPKRDDKKKVISKSIGDYIYTFKNKGYDNYRIIGRDNIEEILNAWEVHHEKLKQNR